MSISSTSNYLAMNLAGMLRASAMKDDSSAPDLGALSQYVGYHLRLTSNSALRQLDKSLASLELTTAMYGVLEMLSRNAALSQGFLARHVGLTNSSMVPLVDKLHARGLVERARPDHDRRTVYLTLTTDGRRCWTKASRLVGDHEKALRANLSDQEARTLVLLLKKLGAGQKK